MLVAFFVVPGLAARLAGGDAWRSSSCSASSSRRSPAPPLLVLLGPNVDRWRIGAAPDGERSRLMAVVAAALRRPAPVAIAIGAVVLLLAGPGARR